MVTVRTFRVAKTRRSRRFKQWVIPVYFSPVKQIAIRQKQRKRPHRRPLALINNLRQYAATPIILLVIGLAGLTFFGIQLSQGKHIKSAKSFGSTAPAATATKPKYLPRSEPTHITIGSVGIDTGVISVGRDANGGIEMPPLFDWTTGWYKYSPTPGQLGPAIIVGHVDTYKGISVFWKLRDVKPGDLAEVTRADGRVVKFKVTALKQFDQANFPTKEVYGNINYAGLRLITCGGAFDGSTGSYTQNTVVYASEVT